MPDPSRPVPQRSDLADPSCAPRLSRNVVSPSRLCPRHSPAPARPGRMPVTEPEAGTLRCRDARAVRSSDRFALPGKGPGAGRGGARGTETPPGRRRLLLSLPAPRHPPRPARFLLLEPRGPLAGESHRGPFKPAPDLGARNAAAERARQLQRGQRKDGGEGAKARSLHKEPLSPTPSKVLPSKGAPHRLALPRGATGDSSLLPRGRAPPQRTDLRAVIYIACQHFYLFLTN